MTTLAVTTHQSLPLFLATATEGETFTEASGRSVTTYVFRERTSPTGGRVDRITTSHRGAFSRDPYSYRTVLHQVFLGSESGTLRETPATDTFEHLLAVSRNVRRYSATGVMEAHHRGKSLY